MDDEVEAGPEPEGWDVSEVVRRAVLSETSEGRALAAAFVADFGRFVSVHVRPVLRDAAHAGDDPQRTVAGLAQLLRDVADAVEFRFVEDTQPAADGGSTPTGDA